MGMYSIYKKELRLFFGSSLAYVVILVFQALSGIYFYTDLAQFSLFLGQDLNLGLWRFVYHDVRWVLFLMIPLLTMRLFAEEKKLGSRQAGNVFFLLSFSVKSKHACLPAS